MNKNKYLIITVIALCFLLTISGTVAYFDYSVNGRININTANYTLNITSESISNQAINLGNNLKPYDKGSFTINLNLNGTNTDVLTTVSIERVNLPKGFKFLAQDDNISPFSIYSKTFEASTSTKTDSVTVYWYWDGDVDDESDSAFINQSLSANIVVKSKQMNGAMMKNGNSSESANRTEFWTDTYRPYIRTITFVNNLSNVPSSCTGDSDLCWDISYSSTQEKKVYAYLIDSGLDYTDSESVSHDLYNLYIASIAPIYAPESCLTLFKDFINLFSIAFNDNFDTSKVTTMNAMFSGCSSLAELDLSSFNTSNVVSFWGMFTGCSSLTSINLSSINSANIANMKTMFNGCSSLAELDLSSFNTVKVTDMSGMFQSCKVLTSLDLSSFNTSSAKNMTMMFNGCIALKSINISSFNTSKVTSMKAMFQSCKALTDLNLSHFNTPLVTDMSYMFAYCNALTSVDVSNFNTEKVELINYMFRSCEKLTSLDLSSFNTSKVTNMYALFCDCRLLERIKLGAFDTSKVTNMGYMFDDCSSLTSLDLSNFNTPEATDMKYMFYNCKLLTNLDLSGFNTSKVTDMNRMFSGCESLTATIGIMNSAITSYAYMFNNAAIKNGAQITVNYTSSASTVADSMIATKSSTSNVVKGTLIS